MTAVDLGCSSGQNTLFLVSKVIKVVGRDSDEKSRCNPVELQFFLNDLPGNDFNYVFRSLERFKESIIAEQNTLLPPFYIAGLPGTCYTRLFPRQSCHLFHSSYCLHWLSRVPQLGKEHLNSGTCWIRRREYLNGGNICVDKTTPAGVAELYRLQFQKDMLLFLKLRHEELVLGGQMMLTFLGRKYEDIYNNGYVNHTWGLLAQSLRSLVKEGLLEKEKLDSFNLPIYAPSVNEVKEVVAQNGLFNISHIKLFESNWDPHDDSEGGEVQNSEQSGINIAKSLRAVFGPLLAKHFGESLLNRLFKKCANYATQHLERGEGKYLLICVSLKRT
ncbi:anthranilate O-methyltransferase 3-like [Triticum aestivum]|uniref:Jasmonate O-methyltransferase n=1 Tax=Aegilops tauschii TaxID=37682 RepID=M8BYP8_AEGTA|nr:anthranilate O-methyltransferase 3-like [Triticum aestivum]